MAERSLDSNKRREDIAYSGAYKRLQAFTHLPHTQLSSVTDIVLHAASVGDDLAVITYLNRKKKVIPSKWGPKHHQITVNEGGPETKLSLTETQDGFTKLNIYRGLNTRNGYVIHIPLGVPDYALASPKNPGEIACIQQLESHRIQPLRAVSDFPALYGEKLLATCQAILPLLPKPTFKLIDTEF